MAPLEASFAIFDQREAESILRDLDAEGARLVWTESSGRRGRGRVVTEAGMARLVPDESVELSGTVRLAFALYGVPVLVECDLEKNAVKGSLTIWSEENRASTRVIPEDPMEIEWCSERDGGLIPHRAPLLDIGTGGARVLCSLESPTPSARTFAATIWTKDTFVHCMAEIRSRKESARGTELGLKLTPQEPAELADVVLRTLFPQVKLRREVPAPELRRLFRESGYFKLRDGCAPSDEWSKIDADALTRDVVYVSRDGEALAHGSVTRAYRNTWLAHQTAMRSNHPEAASARKVLTAMTMITSLLDGPSASVVAYYDPSKPYGRVFFDRFADSVANPDLAIVAGLDWFERDTAPLVLETKIPDSISVSLAQPHELSLVTNLARRQLPRLLADAIDLHPARLRSAALHPAYAMSPFSRSREVFVVKIHDRIVGAALCELTSKHMSLFNTLNLAQFFFNSGVDARAHVALQHRVRRFYDEHEIGDPFVVAPPDSFDATQYPHTRFAMRIGCITWSFEGIRAYENYLRLRCNWLERGQRPRLQRRAGGHPS